MMLLLFSAIFFEMFVILLLLFRTSMGEFLIVGLDRMKRGRGSVMVGGAVFVVFLSTVHSIIDITNLAVESGAINPTDQVLMARSVLYASLMGFILFLGLMIDRLHHYIREMANQIAALRSENDAKAHEIATLRSENDAKAHEIASLKNDLEKLKNQSPAAFLQSLGRRQSEGD